MQVVVRRRSNNFAGGGLATVPIGDVERLPCVRQVVTSHLPLRIIHRCAVVFQPRTPSRFQGTRNSISNNVTYQDNENYEVNYVGGSLKFSPPGSEKIPWKVGENVTAYTNGIGGLGISGTGAVASMPWTPFAAGITKLVKAEGVTGLEGIMATLPDLTGVNGLTLAGPPVSVRIESD